VVAVAVDASTPARWSAVDSGTNVVSASFTAPANALLVLCVSWDTTNVGPTDATTVTDSGGLTWTQQVARLGSEATGGGGSGIWTARTTSAAARTVTVKYPSLTAGAATKRISCKLFVLTGVDVDGTPVDTVGANNEGGTNTDPTTTSSLTPGASGLLVVSATDWNQTGLATSSDLTYNVSPNSDGAADYTGAISVIAGYKACTSGVAVTANLNPPATPQYKWCQVVVRQAAAAATKAPPPFRRPWRFFRQRL
jgi:hypothetical protein